MDPNTQEEKVKISFVMILCIMFAICIIGGFWIGRGIAPKEYVPMQISSEEMEKIAKQYLDWHPELIPTVKTAQEKIYKQIIDNTYAMKKKCDEVNEPLKINDVSDHGFMIGCKIPGYNFSGVVVDQLKP